MKTIEYPIKELISFRMDENKIWWLEYNENHELFPNKFKEVKSKYGDFEWKYNKSGYKVFVGQTSYYCKEQNFLLEGDGCMVLQDRTRISWDKRSSMEGWFPSLLFPYGNSFFCKEWKRYDPAPYYGNPHYKKYIDDNNGECPLPFPKDMKWWEE